MVAHRKPGNRLKAGKRGNPQIAEAGKATRFKEGQSGNPDGRPKWKLLSDSCRAKLAELVPGDKQGRNYAELITDALFAAARRGNVAAFEAIADRTEGKPAQAIAVSGSLDLRTPEEINARIRELTARIQQRETQSSAPN